VIPRLTPAWRQRLLLAARGSAAAAGLLLAGIVAVAAWRARFTAPEPTLLLEDRHGRFLGSVGEGKDGEHGYWPVDKLPPRVVAATLALEDRRFWDHPGVDPAAVLRAVKQNFHSGRRVSGASTIAMQLARLEHPESRSYLHKAVEAVTAVFLVARYGREAVLAEYLRVVPYGNGIRGIGYAARRYLDKPVEDLSWAEIAFLSALPQAPSRMNPFEPRGREMAVARGRRILRSLHRKAVVSREEYELAMAQIRELRIPDPVERPENALHAILHLRALVEQPAVRKAFAARPIVKTTLDLTLQNAAAHAVSAAVDRWKDSGAAASAAILVERETGRVRAWVGSPGYFRKAGAIDYTRVPRSPGSALKPFLYAQALERGDITPATILDDLERGSGGITNADDLFLGPLLPRVALANSRNVPAANLLARIGLDEGSAFLRDLGLHDGALPASRYGLGLAIGGMPVTLENLVRAYTALSGDGRVHDLVWLDAQSAPPGRRVLSEETARLVTLFLADPMARLPSFARMGATEYPFAVAVKTGTSSNYRDAWTVAWSGRWLLGVWVGHPDFRSMNRLTGYRSAALLARDILASLHSGQMQGLEDLSFPPPRGYRSERICGLSGKLATAACDRVFLEWFRPGTEPTEDCQTHVRVAVDRRSGQLASSRTPREMVDVRTFAALEPRYAAWAEAAGLPRLPGGSDSGRALFASRAPAFPTFPAARGQQRQRAPAEVAEAAAGTLRITSPSNGLRLLRDPETPAPLATLGLAAVSSPPAKQILWYVDGRPFSLADYPYSARWPLSPGEHIFQAKLPYTAVASQPVRVTVQ
jgi:penicillin-binding protein 1C